MARISKRLHGPALITSSAVTKYTVPALTKTIVKYIHVSNPSASAVTLTMSIGSDAAAVRIFDVLPILASSVFIRFVELTLEATEIIQALAGTTNILTLTINGDESTLS